MNKSIDSHRLLWRKIFLTMKFILIFLLLGICNSFADSYAQNEKLSIKAHNVTIAEVVAIIEKQSDYVFFYKSEDVDNAHRYNLELENRNINEILDRLVNNTSLVYKISGKYVFLNKKESTGKIILQQQKTITVTGLVLDEKGEPIPGTTVIIEGSTKGVITDINGSYSIEVQPNDKLSFSFIGMETQTVEVNNQTKINVILKEKANELEEVTVVAFGKQKKESVIGSITTVDPGKLKVPSSNLTTAFAGQMAGVIAYQRSGEPGADDADFFVRGITTFGGRRDPLILIDNVELSKTDLSRLQPDDIASFSVMKDATATALYGARGANGVILVTTKQGQEGPMKISVRVENSLSTPTRKVELADPVTWMQLANEASLTRNPNAGVPYSDEKIANTISGRDPLRYPAVDWMDMLIRDFATSQRYNVNVSGGGAVARYYVAGSLNHDNGILNVDKRQNFNNNINNNSYTLRSNIELRLTKTTDMNVRLSGTFDDYSGPLSSGTDIFNLIIHSNSVLFPAYYPATEETSAIKHIMFGNKDNAYSNPYAETVRGYKERSRSQMLAQVELLQDLNFLTKGLSVKGLLNISRLSQFSVSRFYNPYWYEMSSYDYNTGHYTLHNTNTNGTDFLDYGEGDKVTNATFYAEAMANYNRTFGDHGISGLMVGTMRQSLDANTGSLQMSLPFRNLGLSGRFTYAYINRYFLEFNFGYNGSERFAKSHRFGFFPSVGIAWNIANESFWETFKQTVNNLKLRYSYGLVGNDQIGSANDRFYYLSELDMWNKSRGASFGTDLSENKSGILMLRDANPNIGWEISYKQNYALELGLWNNLTLIAEYFREKRTNILMNRSYIPQTMGLSYTARTNVGEASGSGVDLSLEYQKSWNKDFWTSARANFTYATSRYDVYDEPNYKEPWRYRTNRPISQQWGLIAERLFVDDAEAENSAPQEVSNDKYQGGDIKYTDVNRDGKITIADMVPIGLPITPEIVYGFGISTGYKGFDFSMFFQGLTNESFWIDSDVTSPFQGNTQLLQVYADSHWSEANRDLYAIWPRLSLDKNYNNMQWSTWWMRDGSFLRLKQAEVGYTLPGSWKKKLKINNLRVYMSGTNLFLWSNFKLWDVEMAGNGLGYPIQRIVNLGINVTFN